jgi:uncharacterized membrane protein YebE (DUF533 family)
MALQKVLGALLASRLAGRGGVGGALGAAALVSLGGRGGVVGKAGLAALAFLAYRAWRDEEERRGPGGEVVPAARADADAGVTATVTRIVAALRQAGKSQPAPSEPAISETRALLLIRAMIAAAHSDGALSEEERRRIVEAVEASGVDPTDQHIIWAELARPRPLEGLLAEVQDKETAQQVYFASRAALAAETPAGVAYLRSLRARLGLSEEEVAEAEAASA